MIKISFLILTHNRPELFKQCINSILQFDFPFPIEIIINNDSIDIKEIYKENIQIKYFYEQSTNLSLIYKFLFDQAIGEYIYYLEDDDYLLPGFFKGIELILLKKYDLIIGLYKSTNPNHIRKLIYEFLKLKKNNSLFIYTYFQLGQIIFKKDILDFPKFINPNNIENDEVLFKNLKPNTFKYINNLFFCQTIDGQNLSLRELIC